MRDKRLENKTILLAVTGGIAAFKAATLCSNLVKAGAKVRVMMTKAAGQFIAPLTFQTLTSHPVAVDVFPESHLGNVQHIDWADQADLVVIVPATANFLGKLAHGIADDILSTTLLAVTSPVLVAPAMNVHMWEHPAVQRNVETLRKRDVTFIEPEEGKLACGYNGKGRLANLEEIHAKIHEMLFPHLSLKGKRVLITAGGTVERLDPMRYLSNESSGKMGFAFAEIATARGAEVILVYGRTEMTPPQTAEAIAVESASQMREVVMAKIEKVDMLIKTAAVADYRPVQISKEKIKKTDEERIFLEMVRNPDILQEVGKWKETKNIHSQLSQSAERLANVPFIIGFAAETMDMEKYAQEKLKRKKCDLIVANNIKRDGAGFGEDTNIVDVFDSEGKVCHLQKRSKREVAAQVLDVAQIRLGWR